MDLRAAGAFRRTQAERDDQLLSWRRPDRAFFAAGACHILAWTCRELFPDQPIGVASLRATGGGRIFHTFAVWNAWAFDHCGWQSLEALVEVNEVFDRVPLEPVEIGPDPAGFCREHHHRMPQQYYADPRPRARAYVRLFAPPWARNNLGPDG